MTSAALDLFVEKGYAATRLDDIAAHAGVSKGTLYLYFANKDALFKAVVEEGIVPLLAAAEKVMLDYPGTSAELLRHLLTSWWEWIGDTRLAGIPKLVIAEAHNFPDVAQYYHDEVIVRGRALLQRILQQGIERGEFRPVDVETSIDVIFAPLLMLAVWRSSLCVCGHNINPDTFLQSHFDLLLQGLQTPEYRK